MKLGSFHIEQLSEGPFRIYEDGTIRRPPNRPTPPAEDRDKPEQLLEKMGRRDGFRIGIGPILVSRGNCHILLDAGLGWGLDAGSEHRDVSNVKTNLDIFGLRPRDITHVILSHLHYDHAAGISWTDGENRTRPTFPNAKCYLQRREWEAALEAYGSERELAGAGYDLDEVFRLMADGRLELLETVEREIVPGVRVLRTGGHTAGHQAVHVKDGNSHFWYLGDLLPDDSQLNHYAMQDRDTDPLRAKKRKLQLLKKIHGHGGLLLFYHSLHAKSGTLLKDKEQRYVLQENR